MDVQVSLLLRVYVDAQLLGMQRSISAVKSLQTMSWRLFAMTREADETLYLKAIESHVSPETV